MGWFPARDKDNLVPIENLNFPNRIPTIGPGVIKGKRAHQTMKGTKKHPIPAVGTPGPMRPRSMYRQLSDNALVLGWHDGKRLKKGTN
jgi:hypothetical protein